MRFLLLFLLAATLPALEIGAKAPPLTTVTWIKGGPVSLGTQVTVVEFWATWCGPCRTSIPHLTELAKQYADSVAFVGLSDEDAATVTPFVAQQGETMDYHVGLADEPTHAAYMQGVEGIPFAYVVSREGLILWKGHPMRLDPTLARITAGAFDASRETKIAGLNAELQQLLQQDPGNDTDGIIRQASEKISEILALDPGNSDALEINNLIAHHRNDPSVIRTTISALPLAQIDGESAAKIALSLIIDEAIAFRYPDLALKFAEHAVATAPNAAAGYGARATVLQTLGLADDALVSQERAAQIAPAEQQAYLDYLRELKRLRTLALSKAPLTPPEPAPTSTTTLPATMVP